MTHQNITKEPANFQSGNLLVWLATIAVVWSGTVLAAAISGVFDVPASEPILPTLFAIVIPVVAFVGAVSVSRTLRNAALAIDPVLLTEFQAWRILGGVFLVVYAFGHLPGFFAGFAGIGDVAVGIAAPFVAWRLRKNPQILSTARFRLFHYLGLFDFVVAVGTGIASRNAFAGIVGDVTTAPMGQIPLVLIPTIAVPAFIIMHLIVLMQSFRAK